MKTLMLLSLGLISSSCMHVGMMETHRDRPSTGHQAVADAMLEKEVTSGDIKATAVFPSLLLGKESVFTLRLIDVGDGRPFAAARVSFHATYLHKADDAGRPSVPMMHTAMDSAQRRSSTDHSISFDRELKEQSQRGLYSIAFTPSQSGEHTMMFHVTASGNETVESELLIEATRNVASGTPNHGGMTHGMSSTSEYLIVGGALMGAMMVVMWATRGWMF